MTRSTALEGDWKNHEPPESFPIAVSIFLESGADDTVFVAARRSKHFKRDAEYYHRLKIAGLVT